MVRITGLMVKTVAVESFCYHRDRPGSIALREKLREEQWSYMAGGRHEQRAVIPAAIGWVKLFVVWSGVRR
jgi:hypothetical protein